MSNYGIKVSKPGENVNTSGTNDLFLDSTYSSLKVAMSGTGTLSITEGGGDSDTISHNLGYIPRVLVYGQWYDVSIPSKVSTYTVYPIRNQVVGVYISVFSYTIDSSDLVIAGNYDAGGATSDTFSYFYYIFYDEA